MPRGDIRQLLVKAIFSLLEIWNGGSRIRVSFQKLVVQTELSSGRFSFGRDERGELAFLCYCASGPSLDSSQCTISDFFFPSGFSPLAYPPPGIKRLLDYRSTSHRLCRNRLDQY